MKPRNIDRRTVIKGIGAGVAGSAAVSGAVSAGDPDNRRNDSYTWAHNVIYEMLATEPLVEDPKTGEPVNPDSEGNHEGMRPIYLVQPQNDAHSPHADLGFLPPFDHVIFLEPSKKFFSAQWHNHWVVPAGQDFPALAKTGVGGKALTSEARILEASSEGLVDILPLFTPEDEPAAFTCPVRPHQHTE